jgi:TRAP-type C4-dicarboxylate transport system permease small subunit
LQNAESGGAKPGRLVDLAGQSLFYLGGLIMLTITGIVIYAVVMRYYFSAPPRWGEPLALLLFAWLVFIGAAHATLTGGNVAVEVLLRSLPKGVQRVLLSFYAILSIVFLVVVAWKGIPMFNLGFRSRIFGLDVPTVYASGGLFVSCVLMILAQLRWLWLHAVAGVLDTSDSGTKVAE